MEKVNRKHKDSLFVDLHLSIRQERTLWSWRWRSSILIRIKRMRS